MYRGKKITSIESDAIGATGRHLKCFSKGSKPYTITKIETPNTNDSEVRFIPTESPSGDLYFQFKKPEKVSTIEISISDLSKRDEIIQEYFTPTDGENANYTYINSIIYTPVDSLEEVDSGVPSYPTYNFSDVFNYRAQSYIEYIENLPETEIPNFYLSFVNDKNEFYKPAFVFKPEISPTREIFTQGSLENYYQERSEQLVNFTKKIIIKKDAPTYTSVQKEIFPLSVDMKFNFTDTDFITNKLDNFSMHESFLDFFENPLKNDGQSAIHSTDAVIQENDFNISNQPINTSISSFNFMHFLQKTYYKKFQGMISIPDMGRFSYFSNNINKMELFSDIIFKSFYDPLSFEQMLNNQNKSTELLYIKVSKYLGDGASGDPLLTVYLPGNRANYNYFDTQVKNRTRYTYKITGIYLMPVTKYYTKKNNISGGARIHFYTQLEYKVAEVDLLEKQVYILQPLQFPPKVNVSKHLTKNKVNFYLYPDMMPSIYKPFIPIVENDQNTNTVLQDTKQYTNPEHRYVDEIFKYEIFRTETKPASIEDFRGAFLLETDGIRDHYGHNFVDTLEYGKNYYYLFRTLNSERFPGNPTLIYEVRLEKGIEENFLFLKTMDFPMMTVDYDIMKHFNSLMHIYPNDSQNVMTNLSDFRNTGFKDKLSQINVGLEDAPSVWGKKFKIRLTSNNSGRKLDFNVRFSIKRKNNN
jgi:hypothetical protein|tara:strand:+ start:2491 stop:4584 length:2094 start_codon:yes stop_codon:yes gene_type:complete